MRMRSWSIRRLLLLAFIGVLLPYLALVGIGMVGFRALWQRVQAIEGEALTEMQGVAELQVALFQVVVPVHDYFITGDPAERDLFEKRLTRVREALARAETAHMDDPEERRLLEAVRARLSGIEALSREILALPDPRAEHAAPAKNKALDELSDAAAADLARFREISDGEIREEIRLGRAILQRVQLMGLAAAVLSLIGGLVLALLFSRWIGRPLAALARASRAMAEGDLSQRIEAGAGGEFGETARAFNLMAERLEASHAGLERANQELSAVNAVARALASTLELKKVLKILAQRAATAVGADRCAIALRRGGHLVLTMGQFADGHTDPALWEKFGNVVGSYLIEKDPAHDEAIRTRRTVAIEDAAGSPLVPRHWVQEFGSRSLLVVPLVWHDQAIGTLTLDRTDAPHAWSQEQIDLAMTIADQAALAIENARLFEETERRRRSAEALRAVGSDLAQSLDLDVVAQGIIDHIPRLLGARFSSLLRLEPGSGDLVMVAVSENAANALGPNFVFPKGVGAVGLAVRDRRLVVSEDVLADPRITFTPEVRTRIEQASFRAVLAVPLLSKGRVIGVLSAGDEPGRVFDAEEIQLAQAFADQAVVALENARLYKESEARRRSAEALAAVARDLAQSLDPTEVFQRITDSLGRLLASPTTTLYRSEPESGDLRVLAGSGASTFGAGTVFPRGGGTVGLAIELRGPVVSENALTDPRLTFSPEARARVEESGFLAALAVPLVVKERVIGGLGIRDQEWRVFTAEEVRLAQAFADQAAIALENARLFEEAEHALADLKATQEQLVQGATMRALGELASGAAHHLNNLMAIVLGRVRLLLSGPESSPVRRPLEVIERAAVDAAEVVRRVSRFARMQPIEEQARLDLTQLASDVLELTRARWQDAAQAQGLRLDVAMEGEGVPDIAGNAAALREVLTNLVLNAVDALPEGGKITLRTFSEEGWVGLSVTDTGMGMSPAILGRAPEPFFTTKGPKSMGLGLSVSYGILQRHRGELAIESAEGRGTTVTIRLPVASSAESKPAQAEPGRAAPAARRILVIDDDEEVREVVAEMLAAQGHAVIQAAGGRQGLALLEAGETVDLVLTDLGMAGMTGWEVAQTIKARWPHLPVGILTGWADQIDEASLDGQLVVGMVSKPVTPEGLHEFLAACPSISRRT